MVIKFHKNWSNRFRGVLPSWLEKFIYRKYKVRVTMFVRNGLINYWTNYKFNLFTMCIHMENDIYAKCVNHSFAITTKNIKYNILFVYHSFLQLNLHWCLSIFVVHCHFHLRFLFQVWHKGCFKCQGCGMTLNMKTYKGYNKQPYCEA